MLRPYDLDSIAAHLSLRPMLADAPTSEQQAAVAIVLRATPESDEAQVLLIRRADREGDPWSGHMAFPGGRRSELDADLLTTAVRETYEELGLDLAASAKLVTRLDDVRARARGRYVGLTIAVFVFALHDHGRDASLLLNHEVAEALWVPLAPLARGDRAGTYAYPLEGLVVDRPCWYIGQRVVWGLTYQMLTALVAALDEP